MRPISSAFVPTVAAMAATVALAAATVTARQAASAPAGVTVHEWGTFTSVAGPDGQAVKWAPFSGPQDLPCFVTELNPVSVKVQNFVTFDPGGTPVVVPPSASGVVLNGWLPSLRAAVRMETPVLYFYSPVDASASVTVRFPQGLITEWYPRAMVPPVMNIVNLSQTVGSASWYDVKILPHAEEAFPTDSVKSHYYAARATDAAPVRVGEQLEKFLFYRGLANFPVTVTATLANASVVVRNGGSRVPNAILFESDGRRMGYRIAGPLDAELTVARPALTASVDSAPIRQELEALLVAQGLYPREAAAMVETWRDSWFEPGLRIIYLVPRETVDAVLPLSILPAPAQIARVFVGRLELITPAMEAEVGQAIRAGDVPALMRHGRFLEPIANRITPRMSAQDQVQALTTLKAVASKFTAAAAVCR